MLDSEKGLFELSEIPTQPKAVHNVAPRPKNDSETEERRRKMAEDRLGEAAVLIPGIGYVAASSLTKITPSPVDIVE